MAIAQHLKILKEGVDQWNDWRYEHPKIVPDLSGADLRGEYLYEVNFSDAKLSEADLTGADLTEAILGAADMNLAILNGAILIKAKLSKTNLFKAKLIQADLTEAILGAADLGRAKLMGATLRHASLRATRLIGAILDGADLTGARLWQVQYGGWSIEGIMCEYAYWEEDKDGNREKTVYAPGDFERLFKDRVKVKVFYENGISPLEITTLPLLIEHMEQSYPGCKLRLVSISESARKIVVELAIEESADESPSAVTQLKASLESYAKEVVEYQRQALLGSETRLQLESEIKQLTSTIERKLFPPSAQIIVINQGGSMRDIKNVGQVIVVGDNAHAHDMVFNHTTNQMQQPFDFVDFIALATELAELRRVIAAQRNALPEATVTLEKLVEAETAANEKNTSKVVESLKTTATWVLDFAKEIGKDVVVNAIKQSMSMP